MPSTKNQRGDLSTTGDELILEAGSGNATTLASTATANRAVNLPDAACTLAGYNTTQTWTGVQNFQQNTLELNDADNSHGLILNWNESEASSDRTLNLLVNGGNRSLDLSANLTLGSSAALTTATGAITLTGDAGGNSALTLANATSVVGGNSNATDLLTRTATQSAITNKTFTALKITAGSTIDAGSSGTLGIGNTNATTITLGRSGQTTVIAGNLQVDGTTTTVNSTTLDVTDPNITVNNGGNQAAADEVSGLTVEMSDATDAKLIYSSSAASRFKIGDAASEVEIADISTAQTLTNKSIDSDNNTITNIVNADIKSTAAIARTKIADGTADHVVINDGSGTLSSEASLAISRGGTGAATAAAGFDALAPTTTKGDIIAYSTTNARLPIGADNQILTADSAQATGMKWGTAVVSNPMTTTGDIIYSSDGSGTPARLGVGANGQALVLESGLPAWSNVLNTAVNSVSSANYTVLDEDGYSTILFTTGASNRTAVLPAAANNTGRVVRFVKVDTGAGFVTIQIPGPTTVMSLYKQNQYAEYVSDGTSWHCVNRNNNAGFRVNADSTNTFGTTFTTVIFNESGNLAFDDAGGWDATDEDYTIPTGQGGLWHFTGTLKTDVFNDSTTIQIWLAESASLVTTYGHWYYVGGSAANASLNFDVVARVADGATLMVLIDSDDVSNSLDTSTSPGKRSFFMGQRIGD